MLGTPSFPFDALDEIFTFACENSRKRCLDLGMVCKTWQARFFGCDRLWTSVLSFGRERTPKSWTSYRAARLLGDATRTLRPLPVSSLHPIEDCTLEYLCPMVAENLKAVGPGTLFCDRCNKNVYMVRTQREFDTRAANSHCVLIRRADIDPAAEDRTVIKIAVIYEPPVTAQLAKHFLATIAASCNESASEPLAMRMETSSPAPGPPPPPPTPLNMRSARSPYASSSLAVRPRPTGPGAVPRICRFHLLSLEEALGHSDNEHTKKASTPSATSVFTCAIRLTAQRQSTFELRVQQDVPFFKSLEGCGAITTTIEVDCCVERDSVTEDTLQLFKLQAVDILRRIDAAFNPKVPVMMGGPPPPPRPPVSKTL